MTDLYQLRPLEWRVEQHTNYLCHVADCCFGFNYIAYEYPNEIRFRGTVMTLDEVKKTAHGHYLREVTKVLSAASPASIVARYEELKQEGLIVTGQGSATVNIEGRQE